MDFEYKLMLIAKDARKKALEEGRKEGRKEGRREARLSDYSSLVRDGILSLSDAISLSGLNEEEINGWIQTHPNT